jgi:bile acid:Na+ symporter, BASS family
MNAKTGRLESLAESLHHNLIWLLLGSYSIAALVPAPGRWVRSRSLGRLELFGEATDISLPLVLLGGLLLNAGLGVRASRLKGLVRQPLALSAGLFANLAVPVAAIFMLSQALRVWHNPDEVQNVLVGLALIASMPIAGSSTAWAQNADGDLALALGLVLLSTILSPFTTPAILHAVGWMTVGDYSEDLHELAAGGTVGFLAIGVLLPCVLGMIGRAAAGEKRMAAARPGLKLANMAILLALNYTNATAALPQVVSEPDWDFLAAILVVVTLVCAGAFVAGWGVARLVRADAPRQTSLVFGLGMNNNGTGLVLAGTALADHPLVLLPILVYNLVQHLAAGVADRLLCSNAKSTTDRESSGTSEQSRTNR